MTQQMLSTRKMAMGEAKGWSYGGLNSQAIDRAGSVVAASWWRVVDATDGGTQQQVEAAIAEAEAAEARFRQEYPA